jgi:hypothetical protein
MSLFFQALINGCPFIYENPYHVDGDEPEKVDVLAMAGER